jgi:antitoxin ParD1/3/4
MLDLAIFCYWKETAMNVSLTPELERRVEDRVRSGMYGSASEVIREALRLFFRHDEARMREVDDLDHRIGIGLAELDRGFGIPGDEARRRSRSRILERSTPSPAG